MKRVILCTTVLGLFLVSCASQPANAQDAKPEFRVTVKNADDTVSILDENSQTIVDIHSDFGIGSASFELTSGTMPDSILLRLNLKGLEDFRLISAVNTITASISSGDMFSSINQKVVSSNTERPILSTDPLWMNIEIVSENKRIPLEEGHFEIEIPREFLRNAGASFEVTWVDFYR